MPELSVIVPFCNEYPQVIFTLQNLAQELRGRVDFEILAVDNWCKEVADQGRERDRGGEVIEGSVRVNPWLRYLRYDTKLSHWQCKNEAVGVSSSPYLFFCDAHCIVDRDALYRMVLYYREHHRRLDGTLHLPLTYHILEPRKLIYKLVNHYDKGEIRYSFTEYRDFDRPYRVPCMSTCGMLMTRDLYDSVGGWPEELGIYGGGENFLNFTLAVLGKHIHIMPGGALHHHGEKRGYHWNYTDQLRNRAIASYCIGGLPLLHRFLQHSKGRPEVLAGIEQNVIATCSDHHTLISSRSVMCIEDWLLSWQEKETDVG